MEWEEWGWFPTWGNLQGSWWGNFPLIKNLIEPGQVLIWKEVNNINLIQVVKLDECEIYVYNPDPNADPFLEEGAMWVTTSLFFFLSIQSSSIDCQLKDLFLFLLFFCVKSRWSFCFLFYNRKQKRVAGFRFCCTRLDDCHPTWLSASFTVFFLKRPFQLCKCLLQ